MTTTETFFSDLYGETEGGYLSTWEKQEKSTTWHPINDIEKLIDRAAELSASGRDAYFGVCPRRMAIYEEKNGRRYAVRGGESDVHSVPALWMDIDIQEPGAHAKHELPASKEEALAFLYEIPLKPSFIIFSGYGLHIYWLLREPLVINNSGDLNMAKALSSGWGAYIRNLAQQRHCWKFDNVADLARVLRVPGTYNYKKAENPVLVEIIRPNDARYDPSDFNDYTIEERNAKGATRTTLAVPNIIPDGSRDDTLFKLASSDRAKGMAEAEIEAHLLAVNAKCCDPPLSDKDIKKISHSAAKYELGTIGEKQTALALATLDELGESWDDITSDATLNAVLLIQDQVERQRQISKLREKAKKLGRTRDFNDIIRAWLKKADEEKLNELEETDEPFAVTENPLPELRCKGWYVDDTGVYSGGKLGGRLVLGEKACSQPVVLTEILENIDTGIRKVRIAFRGVRGWTSIVVNRSIIASSRSIVSLADNGLLVTTGTGELLVQYLLDLEAQNQGTIPLKRSISHAGWVDKDTFSPYDESIVFDGESSFSDLFGAIRCIGDEQVWLDTVQIARKNILVRMVLAASFASPLLWLKEKLGFFVHLWGETGTGKSVLLMLAASVWGAPEVLIKTFNSTRVGMERFAAFMNSLPLFLDELQTLKGDVGETDKMIYALTEGKSRGMGKRDGGVANEARWRNIVITNGEEPITGEHSGGGSKNRVIELRIKGDLFENAPEIVSRIQLNNGFAGRKYIDGLKHEGINTLRQIFGEVRKMYEDQGTGKQVDDLAILASGEYFAAKLVFGRTEDEARQYCFELAEYLSKFLRSSKDVDVVEKAWWEIMEWIASEGDYFMKEECGARPPVLGKIERKGLEVLIIASKLNEKLTDLGFNVGKSVAGWLERGWLQSEQEGTSTRTQVRTRIGGIQVRCYRLLVSNGPSKDTSPIENKQVGSSDGIFDPF